VHPPASARWLGVYWIARFKPGDDSASSLSLVLRAMLKGSPQREIASVLSANISNASRKR
jgi:hypothetical protein